MNIVKALVLALFAVYWVIVVAILVAAREVYDQVVMLPGNQRPAEIGIMLVLTALLGGLSVGVVRGWRWTFWLILVAFLAGIMRVPASALQLAGVLPAQGPTWFVVLQAVIGAIQFVVALAMLGGYRRTGVWDVKPQKSTR